MLSSSSADNMNSNNCAQLPTASSTEKPGRSRLFSLSHLVGESPLSLAMSGASCPSPMSSLAMNLSGLSTHGVEFTPKRKLSLSSPSSSASSNTPTPLKPLRLSSLVGDDSPAPVDSPTDSEFFERAMRRSKNCVNSMKRYNSMPTQCRSPLSSNAENVRNNHLAFESPQQQSAFQHDDKDSDPDLIMAFPSDESDFILHGKENEGASADLQFDMVDLSSEAKMPSLRPHFGSFRDMKRVKGADLKRPLSAPASLFAKKVAEFSGIPADPSLMPCKINDGSNQTSNLDLDPDDDGFIEQIEAEQHQENENTLSSVVAGLLSAPIVPSPKPQFKPMSILYNEHFNQTDTPTTSLLKTKRGLFDQTRPNRDHGCGFLKRPGPPPDELTTQVLKKKARSISFETPEQANQKNAIPQKFNRTKSLNEAVISHYLNVSTNMQQDLIGDFSKPYSLICLNGKHQDLKSVSPSTVAGLLRGEYSDVISQYHIIDCRYPYEYSSGHIQGAMNYYTKGDVLDNMLYNPITPATDGRSIYIFHCEFSSERGPTLSRYLRNMDREANKNCYPHLHYPEVYLLEGGYKAFYEQHKELCEPQCYLPMAHSDYVADFKRFRLKSKSWNGDKARVPGRLAKK